MSDVARHGGSPIDKQILEGQATTHDKLLTEAEIAIIEQRAPLCPTNILSLDIRDLVSHIRALKAELETVKRERDDLLLPISIEEWNDAIKVTMAGQTSRHTANNAIKGRHRAKRQDGEG